MSHFFALFPPVIDQVTNTYVRCLFKGHEFNKKKNWRGIFQSIFFSFFILSSSFSLAAGRVLSESETSKSPASYKCKGNFHLGHFQTLRFENSFLERVRNITSLLCHAQYGISRTDWLTDWRDSRRNKSAFLRLNERKAQPTDWHTTEIELALNFRKTPFNSQHNKLENSKRKKIVGFFQVVFSYLPSGQRSSISKKKIDFGQFAVCQKPRRVSEFLLP